MLHFALLLAIFVRPTAEEWISMINPITFSAKTIEHVLNHGGYAIISAGRNPAARSELHLADRIIEQRTERLIDDIRSTYVYSLVTGVYDGGLERSFFLILPSESPEEELEDLVHLAVKYNQDSIIYTKKAKPTVQRLLYTTGRYRGRYVEGTGYAKLSSNVTDNYSRIHLCPNADFQFTLNFNFRNMHVNHTQSQTDQLVAYHRRNHRANRVRCRN